MRRVSRRRPSVPRRCRRRPGHPAGPGMAGDVVGGVGRPGEDEPARAPRVVAGAPHPVPCLRRQMPLVDEQRVRPVAQRERAVLGMVAGAGVLVQKHLAVGEAAGRGGLATAASSLDEHRRHQAEAPLDLGVDHPACVLELVGQNAHTASARGWLDGLRQDDLTNCSYAILAIAAILFDCLRTIGMLGVPGAGLALRRPARGGAVGGRFGSTGSARPDRTASRASDARNRYIMRSTRTQHRPASRHVNDHGRVFGTHTPPPEPGGAPVRGERLGVFPHGS